MLRGKQFRSRASGEKDAVSLQQSAIARSLDGTCTQTYTDYTAVINETTPYGVVLATAKVSSEKKRKAVAHNFVYFFSFFMCFCTMMMFHLIIVSCVSCVFI